ncbi:uncharacterized protein LOC144918312 [Branchiostoma floridae x Branchiostoma belcheri]
MFASRGQFSPYYFCRKKFSDFDSISVIVAKCTLPPVWSDQVEPDGSLFYLEPAYCDLHTTTQATDEPQGDQGPGTTTKLPDEQTQDPETTAKLLDESQGKISRIGRIKALIQRASKRKQKQQIVVSARRDDKTKKQSDGYSHGTWGPKM